MIEVELQDVIVRILAEDAESETPRLANRNLRIVLLKERAGERVLPIWIGPFEGDALALQLGRGETPRPLSHDLMARLVEASGGQVEQVAVTRLEENTFYAVVTVAFEGRTAELDARPSDALNLAVRVGAPIYVDEHVMTQAGRTPEQLPEELACPAPDEGGPGEWLSLSPELVKALWPKPPTPEP